MRIDRRRFLAAVSTTVAAAAARTSAAQDAPPSRPASRPARRRPAESEPHARCLMAWPSGAEEVVVERWEDVDATRSELAHLAKAIRAFEPVTVAANPDEIDGPGGARAMLGPDIDVVAAAVDDLWTRDTAPTFVRSGAGVEAVVFAFNAWGGKQKRYAADATFGARIAEALKIPVVRSPLVCEGGALVCDGEGTVLTTESCLLNKNRNPGATKESVEAVLRDLLGARRVVWLPGSVVDKVTDGHVDGFAAFVRPGVVIADRVVDRGDPEFAENVENLKALRAARDAAGRRFEVVELPRPKRERSWGEEFCATYVNFYLPNGGVVYPAFEDKSADEIARKVFAKAFPARKLAPFPLYAIAEGGGGIRCATQEIPA